MWIEENIIPFVYTQQRIILAQLVPAGVWRCGREMAAFDMCIRAWSMSRSLGCNERQAFFRVSAAGAERPRGGAVMTWARGGGVRPILMFCGATKMKTETLPIAVFLNMSVGTSGWR